MSDPERELMQPVVTDHQTEGVRLANRLRQDADRETRLRSDWSPLLGVSVALDDGSNPVHTLLNTAATLRLEISDIIDGKKGRRSNEILGLADTDPIAIEAGQRDHRADKRKYRSQMAGLIMRALVFDRNPRQAAFLGANFGIQTVRDKEMQRTRDYAMANGIKASSRDIGRLKAWFNGGGAGLHTLAPLVPEKYRGPVTKSGNALLALGTVLSMAALVDMKLHVGREDKAIKQRSHMHIVANDCPDFVEVI